MAGAWRPRPGTGIPQPAVAPLRRGDQLGRRVDHRDAGARVDQVRRQHALPAADVEDRLGGPRLEEVEHRRDRELAVVGRAAVAHPAVVPGRDPFPARLAGSRCTPASSVAAHSATRRTRHSHRREARARRPTSRAPRSLRRPARGRAQERDGVGAERLDRIAALLDGDDRHPQRRDRRADARVVIGLQREVADRVGVVRVEAEREDERRIGLERADRLERLLQRREVRVTVRPGRKRQVERRSLAGPGAALDGIAAESTGRCRPGRRGG